MAADPSDLTTVASVQAWKQIAGTTGPAAAAEAAELQSLITAASAWISNYCNRNFVGIVAYSETRHGNGRDEMPLAERPLVSITSLTIDNGAPIAQQSAAGQPGWFIPPRSGKLGPNMLALAGYCFNRGRYNVVVSYTAGWASIPLDVAQACIEIVVAAYKRGARGPDLVSQAVENQTTAFSQADVTPQAKAMLNPYRKVSLL